MDLSNARPPFPAFPIPVVAAPGPGVMVEDETLNYLEMPKGMSTYQAPQLPEPEEIRASRAAVQVLTQIMEGLQEVLAHAGAARETRRVNLAALAADERVLLNQILGEGEVSAQVLNGTGDVELGIQESVFAGIWRVIGTTPDAALVDYIEIGAIPEVLRDVARVDGSMAVPVATAVPSQVMNVPSVLVELEDQRRIWRTGQSAHVVNLTLLPLTPEDIGYLDYRLGTGRVLILSRGYGNCRITNCCVPNTWRVVYYNSMDTVILNSVEVTDMPEVALAAVEDLQDTAQRLTEVMQWVQKA